MYSIFLAVFASAGFITLQIFKSQASYILILKFYTIFEYAVIAYFLMSVLKNKLIISILKYSIIAFTLISAYFYFVADQHKLNKYPSVIEFLLFIVFIIYFFYEKMKTVIIYPLYQSTTFWICVAFFLYFTGNFFFFLFSNPASTPEFKKQMILIYSFVTITKNFILSLSLLANEPIEINDDELQIPTDINLDEFTVTNTKKL